MSHLNSSFILIVVHPCILSCGTKCHIFFSHLIVSLSHQAVPTSNMNVLLPHSVVPFFFLTFNSFIVTLGSTNITCNFTFITFNGSLICFSHLIVSLSYQAVPTSHVTKIPPKLSKITGIPLKPKKMTEIPSKPKTLLKYRQNQKIGQDVPKT